MVGRPGGAISHINPILYVSNISASISFYSDALGLELYHEFGDPADFAIVGRDGNEIYLCQGGQGSPGTWLAIFVADLAGLYEHLTATGRSVLMPLQSDKGEFRVEDPDGHVLRIFGGG